MILLSRDRNCRRDGFTPNRAGLVEDIDKEWGVNKNPNSFICEHDRGKGPGK